MKVNKIGTARIKCHRTGQIIQLNECLFMPDCPFCIIAEDRLCQKDKTAQVKSNGDGIFMKVKEQDSWGDWFDLEYHQSLRFLAITNEQQTAALTYSSSSSSHQQSDMPEHDDAVGHPPMVDEPGSVQPQYADVNASTPDYIIEHASEEAETTAVQQASADPPRHRRKRHWGRRRA